MCPDWDQTTPQTRQQAKKGDKKSEQDTRNVVLKSGMETKVEQGGGRVNGKLQSQEGQQDVPYLEALLIKAIG